MPDINKAYARERNKFIPIAERYANEQEGVKKAPGQSAEEFADRWNVCYHAKMDRLWKWRER